MTQQYEVIVPKDKIPLPKKPQHPAIPLRMMQFAFGTLGRVFPKLFANIAFRFFRTPQRRAKHKVSSPLLEQAQISDLLMGGYMLKTYEWGSGNKTVLLVHGWESRGTALRHFVPLLLEKGYRVVAFDGPAHGNSSGKRVDIKAFAGAIKALTDKYKNIEGLIAHSFGGIASFYALSNLMPEFNLKKMVLIGVPSKFDYPIQNALRTMNAPPKVRKYFYEIFEQGIGMPLVNVGVKEVSDKVDVDEVLVVHDSQDEIVGFEQAEMTIRDWDKAMMQETKGFGHFRLMKSPQVVERVVEFICE